MMNLEIFVMMLANDDEGNQLRSSSLKQEKLM